MRRILLLLTLVGAILLACSGIVLAQQASPARKASRHLAPPGPSAEVCPGPVAPGKARCLSKVLTKVNTTGASPAVTSNTPIGYQPADLQSAYNLQPPSGSPGSGPTVAIVDAYDDPNAESDLQTYRSQFGLSACTSAANAGSGAASANSGAASANPDAASAKHKHGHRHRHKHGSVPLPPPSPPLPSPSPSPQGNGCFTKVDQSGGTSYPSPSSHWAVEISLDLDMVSAICPDCKILLVEANSSSLNDLGTAVNYAASVPGVAAISNSYGGSEFNGETSYESSYYKHTGVAITASSGDSGYGVEFPAASQYVTAVGGTSLKNSGGSWSESVWSGAGSGCSAYIAKPSWQTDGGCSNRTVADVAADADPNTGVAVYDSYGQSGWIQLGGTSVASPIIASVYTLAGKTSSVNDGSLSYNKTSSSSLHDVTSGSNGSCSSAYLCNGETGYDGPTGNGTPNGTGAFQ